MHIRAPREQAKGIDELLRGGAAKQQQRKQGPHGRDGEGAIDTALSRQLSRVVSGLTEQRMDVVAQDLGGQILGDSQLGQPGDMLEREPVLN